MNRVRVDEGGKTLYLRQFWPLLVGSQVKWVKENRFISDVKEMQGSHPRRMAAL